jgi:hypothetical protein
MMKYNSRVLLERSIKKLVRGFPLAAGAFAAVILVFAFLPAEINTRPVFNYSSIYDREEFGTSGVNLIGGPVVIHPHVRDYEKIPASLLEEGSGIGSSICLTVEITSRGNGDPEIRFDLPEKTPGGLREAVARWINTLDEYYVCPIEEFRFEIIFYPESRRAAVNVTKIEGIRKRSQSVFYGPTGVPEHAVNLIPVRYTRPWRPPAVNFTEGTDRIYRRYNEEFKDFTSDEFIRL